MHLIYVMAVELIVYFHSRSQEFLLEWPRVYIYYESKLNTMHDFKGW